MDRYSLGTGWLESRPELDGNLCGVSVPRWSVREKAPFPTRREEYTFCRDALQRLQPATAGNGPRVVIDAGAGFNPEIHLMPEIMAKMGFDVVAVDSNPLSLAMPQRAGVVRVTGTILVLPYLDCGADAWVCISTLEHMSEPERFMALREGWRVLKPGGLAVVTTDETEPAQLKEWLDQCGFQTGSVAPLHLRMLSPRVAWGIARRAE